jgi:RsmE family RNA methyltransferase
MKGMIYYNQLMAAVLAACSRTITCVIHQYPRCSSSSSSSKIYLAKPWSSFVLTTTSNSRYYRRYYRVSSKLFLNRFLLDPSELGPDSDVPTATLPATDYRTIHAAKILGLQNGDTLRAGIVLDSQASTLEIVGGTRKKKVNYKEEEQSSPLIQHLHHPYAGWVTDQATITWIPEGKIKHPRPTKLGEPPGSLQIRLDRLYCPGDQTHVDYNNTNNNNNNSTTTTTKSSLTNPVSLLLALPRPLQLSRLLPMISQMGVHHLILCAAHKVPHDYFGSHLFRQPNELRKCLLEGLCQSGDVRLPRVTVIQSPLHRLFSSQNSTTNTNTTTTNLFDQWFPLDQVARVVAHPLRTNRDESNMISSTTTTSSTSTTVQPLRLHNVTFPNPHQRQILLAVGPEGGWLEPEELHLFQRHHFQQVTLGPRTLRTDVAVISLLALAQDICSS